MDYDKEKVDDMVLALLWLTMFDDDSSSRAWKGHDWQHMDRLHEKGYIGDPKNRSKSVTVSEAGKHRAEELFSKYFGV